MRESLPTRPDVTTPFPDSLDDEQESAGRDAHYRFARRLSRK
jgi:hypothetical protein